ncbi:MAG TPA: serine/threonine-protein kinase [Polyangiaceae bacterium]
MVGRTLRDKWRLDALLDVGGMAAVYAATHRNGMRGAVKILHPETSLVEDIVERFRREGTIANRITHPGALRVLDDDTDDDGRPFLVMELLDGATLDGWAQAGGGRLSAEQVLVVTDELLDVLAAAHELGIVHRDVKPENVFLTVDGRVKVLDFGIARSPETLERWRSTTTAGIPMGSPGFMPPEQARGRWDLVGEQSDLWSVGATMFTLLSGELVHVEETLPELLAASFTKDARSLATVVPDAHPALVALVDRALDRRLASRWPDARSMQAAVRQALAVMCGRAIAADGPVAAAVTAPSMPSRPPPRSAPTMPARSALAARRGRRVRVMAVAGAIGLAVVAAIGVSAPAREPSPTTPRTPAVVAPMEVHLAAPSPALPPAISSDVPTARPPRQPAVVWGPAPLPPRALPPAETRRPIESSVRPIRTMFDKRH